jgi:hypothetical protein
LRKLVFKKRSPAVRESETQNTRAIVMAIFEELQAINDRKNSTLVFVYLPMFKDFMEPRSREWRSFLHAESRKRGFLFVDLVDEIRKYAPNEVATLFDHHYSEQGNAYIAKLLHEKLLAIPEISEKLRNAQAR